MSKTVDSELKISCTVWEKETFELIDYYSNEVIKTKFKVNSSGVISRNNKQIVFTPGDNVNKTSSDLISVRRNASNGKFIIDCGVWSKDLSTLIEEQGAYMVFRGISFKELNSNLCSRYYKLSQGDIIKIGRIFFKVLDIHTKKDNVEAKSNADSTIKGTMMRSSSCSNIIVNGQEIIKGAFMPKNDKKQPIDLHLSGNDKMNPNNDNNSLFVIEKINNQKMVSLELTVKNKEQMLPKVSSSKELFSVVKKDEKINNEEEKQSKKDKKIKKVKKKKEKKDKKDKKDTNIRKDNTDKTNNSKINKPLCRICYGDDSTDDNPLICPCICKGSMKYIHYECLKNWLNSKIEEDISVDSENPEIDVITYNRKDISCELCKEKLPDYVKLNDKFYNISFYKPKFEEFIVLESMRADKHKAKFIHIMSLDNKNCINIGRANECELSISELSVSRFHCIIHKDEGDLFIEDNSSKFGTLILIQNNNMFMNDYIPLKVQISKTYIKFKTIVPFKFNCCKDPFTLETKKYDYQSQNRKCFDILSYFIIKENNQNQEGEDEDEKNSKNDEKLIDDDDNKNAKDEKEVEIESEVNKDLIDEKSCKEEIHSKNNHLDNKSEIENEQKTHSNRIRKINIKKGKNDATELPELDKINIEHFKENMSIMAEKEIKSPLNAGNVNVHQSKTISLIRLNKSDGTYDKTIANPNLGASHNNTGKIVTNQAIINDYKNKK
jgi:hypothetical protein